MLDHITETAKYDSPAEMETSRECPTCGSATRYILPDVWECLACGDQWDFKSHGMSYNYYSHIFDHPDTKIKGPTEAAEPLGKTM
jgi:ribosomal protein L37AE/L43A